MKKIEIDAREIEERTLVYMMKDADRMGEDDTFKRKSDIDLKNTPIEGVVKSVGTHKERAAELFGIDESEVTEAQRQFAKTYYFGELYGIRQSFAEFLKSRGLPNPIDVG